MKSKDTSYVNKKAIELQIAKIGYQDYYNSLNDKNSTNVNIDIDER